MEMPGNRNRRSESREGRHNREPGMEMPGNRNRRSKSRQGRHSRSPAWKCREQKPKIRVPSGTA